MDAPLIICDHLVKLFRVAGRDVVALQGLDMVVERGEMLGVVGVSGSGKSTLMNLLGGLDRPSAGRLWVDGKDMLRLSARDLDRYRMRRVGFVWQQTARNLVPYLTAQENVELPLTLGGWAADQRRPRAAELLALTGLEARGRHRLAELSGGEQQRVGIAVALANLPDLVLADEPTGELDEPTALGIYELFRDLNRKLGLTIVIVSHDPHLAQHTDRVVSIRDGKVSTESKAASTPDEALPGAAASPRAVEELIVVDKAGRLQLPKDLLQQYHIEGRVKLEPADGGILIRPAVPASDSPDHAEANAEALIDKLEAVGHPWQRRAWPVLAAVRRQLARWGGRRD